MAMMKKKKKKGLGGGGGGKGREESPLRPYYVRKTPPCSFACPSSEDIRGYLTWIGQAEKYGRKSEESFDKAWEMITDKNPFPSTMGRVCPHPCESECNRVKLDGAVNINAMERAVGDHGIEKNLPLTKLSDDSHPEKVAVVGGGPAGLSCAYQLARRGYSVTVFEAFDKAGGMLRYGIPTYRLPDDVLDAEIGKITDLGVELKTGVRIGKDVTVAQLQSDYQAVYLAIGAHMGWELGVPGEDATNVMTGAAYLHLVNKGEAPEIGDSVVVIGGGDTAVDAARVSRRLGAKATIVYRRTRNEMPAIEPEIVATEEEDVEMIYLAAPVEVVKDGDKAVSLKCQKCELGEPDASGRRRPVPIEGEFFEVPATFVVPAISQGPIFDGDLEQFKSEKGWIDVNEQHQTATANVYAGGDITVKLGIATQAIGLGREAAERIDHKLRGTEPAVEEQPPVIKEIFGVALNEKRPRNERSHLPAAERLQDFREAELGLSQEETIAEAKRCMSCGLCLDCDNCWMYCQDKAIEKLDKSLPLGEHYSVIMEKCIGCKKCYEACLCGYIEMR
jgi:NADPH-dependent glutamate synthase beta subunit-like oxidoreductase